MIRSFSQRAKANPDRESLLAQHPAEIVELLTELRQFIRDLVPSVKERLYARGRGVGYHHEPGGWFCSIYVRPYGVELSFPYGVSLPDSQGILENCNEGGRYLILRPGQWIDQDLLSQLIQAALMEKSV